MTATTGQAQHTIRRALNEKRQHPGALLPILHAIQDKPG
jgi:NADH:ubiquinone oxidoreductase subunit E